MLILVILTIRLVLFFHIWIQVALNREKFEPQIFCVLLGKVCRCYRSSYFKCSTIFLMNQLNIQIVDRGDFLVGILKLLKHTINLEKLFIITLAEHNLNLCFINFFKMEIELHIFIVFLRNRKNLFVDSGSRLLHSIFKIKNEWFQLLVWCFHNLESISNFISYGFPFQNLFLYFVHYKDCLMTFVYFSTAFNAVVRLSRVILATLVKTDAHDFNTVLTYTFFHAIKPE